MNPTSPKSIVHDKKFDLITLGEILVEFTRRSDGTFAQSIAGDVFNTAFYAARLGLRTGISTCVGTDMFTPSILDACRRSGINTDNVTRLQNRSNGLYFIETDDERGKPYHYWRKGSAASQMLFEGDADDVAAYVSQSQYLLITGVTLAVLRDSLVTLHDIIDDAKGTVKIAFDTNYRASLWESREDYIHCVEAYVLPQVSLILATDDDVAENVGTAQADRDIAEAMERFAEYGAETIVMKAGARGCAVYDGSKLNYYPPPEVINPVSTTGAGDAFNAGFIAGQIRGLNVEASCLLAQETATHALRVAGAIDWDFKKL